MAFEWQHNLLLALQIDFQTNKTIPPVLEEAARRCVIGRAYYAAYCHAYEFACARFAFQGTGTGDDHRGLRDHLIKNKIPGVNMILLATVLSDLAQMRRSCDYNKQYNVTPELTLQAINMAKSVIQKLPR
jgi:hypothetical protein